MAKKRIKDAHLKFYEQAIINGRMEFDGLCHAATHGLIDNELLQLLYPTDEDFNNLVAEGMLYRNTHDGYWGSGVPVRTGDRCFTFTPLRQTIVLFMAAINNEL